MRTPRTNGGRTHRKTRSPGSVDVLAERVRDEVDRVARASVERPDPVVFAERRPPGLEERLRRDHQYAHGLNGQPDACRMGD